MALVRKPGALHIILNTELITLCSYAVYIGILTFYLLFIYFMLPETKHLSAKDAAHAHDYDRKGNSRGKPAEADLEHAMSAESVQDQNTPKA